VDVLMTDSHGELFLRNKLVILAEARGRVVVTNASALVTCEGDVPELRSGAPRRAAPRNVRRPSPPPAPAE
jgi:hypothetical protein